MARHTHISRQICIFLGMTLVFTICLCAGWNTNARESNQPLQRQQLEQPGKRQGLLRVLNSVDTLKAVPGGSFNGNAYQMSETTVSPAHFVSISQGQPDQWDGQFGLPGTNGRVYAVAVSGNDVYIGGDFTRVGNMSASHIAKWDGNQWSSLGIGVSGNVTALAVSGNNLYAGGNFNYAGNNPANRIAKWDGANWTPLGNGINNQVSALVISGNNLFVGGSFSIAGNITANNIAKWDGSNWSALGSGVNDSVEALAVNGDDLFVGGLFTTAGGMPAQSIAKWNGSGWSALGTGIDGVVRALAVTGNDIYAGGSFASAGGLPANNIVKWNGSSWSTLGAGLDNAVNDLALRGNELYVAGRFSSAGNLSARSIAKWAGGTWAALGDGVGSTVNALAVGNTAIYAGGEFTLANNGPGNYLAQWNDIKWSTLGTGNGLTGSFVQALANSGNDLYAGGSFSAAGGTRAFNIAKWDGSSWSALDGGLSGSVYAIATKGSEVYARGEFTFAAGNPANHIAKWDGNSWSPLGAGLAEGSGALFVKGNDLYASDKYFANGSDVYRLVKWSGSDWLPLSGEINGIVLCAAVNGNDVYIGGQFTSISGLQTNNIAKWNGSSWSALGTGVNDIVRTIVVNGSDLYVGGHFTQAGESIANRIARWDGNNWWALGSGVSISDSRSLNVSAIAINGTDLYAGGNFSNGGLNIAKWNGLSWSVSLGGGLVSRPVAALSIIKNDLYVAGSFTEAGNKLSYYFGRYTMPPPSPPAPTITAETALTRLQSTAVTNFSIATVTNSALIPPPLTVMANGNATATVNGVTISNIRVDGLSNGKVTADIVAAANATTASFSLRVTNSLGAFAEAVLQVRVLPFAASLTDPLTCTGAGNTVAVSVSAGNPGAVPLPVVLTATFTNLVGLPGSCNLPGCVVTATGLSYNATLAPGATVTLNYLTRVADGVTPGAQACTNNMLVFNGGQPLAVTTCNTINCPAAGPGALAATTSPTSAQKPGSVLIYNVFTSSASAANLQNTRISLTNTHPLNRTFVHLFFVDGASCSVADSYICLTPNQTATFLAADLDPGTSGYLVAVATDAQGCPTNFNYLIGDEFVKFSSGHAANLGALGITALASGLPLCDGNAATAELRFDGSAYNVLPRTVALDNFPSIWDGNDTLLILNRIGGNLSTGAATLTNLFGLLYGDTEDVYSFSFSPNVCQFRASINTNFPRIVPRLSWVVPAGHTGWLRLSSQNDQALTGAAITASSTAFNQGHNLHQLTTTNTASYVIPVFPPNC